MKHAKSACSKGLVLLLPNSSGDRFRRPERRQECATTELDEHQQPRESAAANVVVIPPPTGFSAVAFALVIGMLSASCQQVLGIEELSEGQDASSTPPPDAREADAPSDARETDARPDTTPPTVVEIKPASDALDVDIGIEISARFDENIDAATVTAESFFVIGDDGAQIDGSITVDADRVTFTADGPLALRGLHTVTLSAEVRDLAGNPLASNYEWNFTVRDGTWLAPEVLDVASAGEPWTPRIAVNARGDAAATWRQFGGTVWDVWAARYTRGEGWAPAKRLEESNGDAAGPELAIDPHGNVVVVWSQFDGTRHDVWSSRYRVGAGWTDAEPLEILAEDARFPQIATDGVGNAVAVWEQAGNVRANRLRARTDTSQDRWLGAETIGGPISFGFPDVALPQNGDNGDGFAAWAGQNQVQAARYVLGSGWEDAVVIAAESAERAQVALDAAGNAVATWLRSPFESKTAMYKPGTGWSEPEVVVTNSDQMFFAMGTGGHRAVGWHTGSDTGPIFVLRFGPGVGWSESEEISVDLAGDDEIYGPRMSVDRQGNVFAAWIQVSMNPDVPSTAWQRRYVVGKGWTEAAQLRAPLPVADDVSDPDVAVDAGGNAAAVWKQSDGARTGIYAQIFH